MEEGKKRKIKMEKKKDKRQRSCNEGNKNELREQKRNGR